MDSPLKPKFVTPEAFSYDESRLDVTEFLLIMDLSQWKALCRGAAERNTTVSALWAAVMEQVLVNANWIDPRDPKGVPCSVVVKLRDIRNNPEALNIGINPILQPELAAAAAAEMQAKFLGPGKKESEEDDDDLDGVHLLGDE